MLWYPDRVIYGLSEMDQESLECELGTGTSYVEKIEEGTICQLSMCKDRPISHHCPYLSNKVYNLDNRGLWKAHGCNLNGDSSYPVKLVVDPITDPSRLLTA